METGSSMYVCIFIYIYRNHSTLGFTILLGYDYTILLLGFILLYYWDITLEYHYVIIIIIVQPDIDIYIYNIII